MAVPSMVLSVRNLLAGTIESFLADQGFTASATASAVVELAVVLAHYREEGTALHPLVFLCEDLGALLGLLHAHDPLVFGEGAESPDTVRHALKVCAPLAQEGWVIFLDRHDGGLRFGVFRTDDFVLRETPLQILRRTEDPSLRAIGVVRVADEVIELRGGVGPSRFLYLSGARPDASLPGAISRELLASLTRDCDPLLRDDLLRFYRSILLAVLRAAHGTLVAVIPLDVDPRSIFDDGVFLPTPLRIGTAIAGYRATRSEAAQASLQSLRALLRGMMASDGVTVLRTDGAIVGFNVFVSHTVAPEGARRKVLGGARRRTFEALSERLGPTLEAAFYRSQDGWTECRRAEGGEEV